MLIPSLLILAFVVIKGQSSPEEDHKHYPRILEGQHCGRTACLNPAVRWQNYQDSNMDVLEFYNMVTSKLDVNTSWGAIVSGDGQYDQNTGLLTASQGSSVTLERDTQVALQANSTTFFQAVLRFNATNPVDIESPLGFDSDPAYGTGSMFVVDYVDTGLYYGFFLTNTVVYALYARLPTTPALTFTYLIPIYYRSEGNQDTYVLALDTMDHRVSWIINDFVYLAFEESGLPIDEKFLIVPLGGGDAVPVFPTAVLPYFTLGNLESANSTCQGGVLNWCDNTLFNSTLVCQYAPIQNVTTYQLDLAMQLYRFSISVASAMPKPCACPCALS